MAASADRFSGWARRRGWRALGPLLLCLAARPAFAADGSGAENPLPSLNATHTPSFLVPSAADCASGDCLPRFSALAMAKPADAPPIGRAGPALAAPDAEEDGEDRNRVSFGGQARSVKWEVIGYAVYMTAVNIHKVTDVGSHSFRVKSEGWFGKDTFNLGMDKLAHAFDTYLLAELLRPRIDRRNGKPKGSAFTAAVLASGLMLYGEFYDGIKKTSGFSFEDLLFNTGGAAFSILRHEVPGLSDKLDFRVMIMPNSDVFTPSGQRHYRQQRYLLALKLAGFKRFEHSPLRFLELHAGYYATGFTPKERARGEELKRKPFVGVGLNLGELFFSSSSSRVSRAAASALEYIQIPYTAVHVH